MFLHVWLLGESHGADGAAKRPLAWMGAQVAFEIELFAKNLIWKEIQMTTFFLRKGAKPTQGDVFYPTPAQHLNIRFELILTKRIKNSPQTTQASRWRRPWSSSASSWRGKAGAWSWSTEPTFSSSSSSSSTSSNTTSSPSSMTSSAWAASVWFSYNLGKPVLCWISINY